MNPSLLTRCDSYLLAHGTPKALDQHRPVLRGVTISREAGAGAITIGQLLTEYLESKKAGDSRHPWAVFDHELVKRVIKDHQLPDTVGTYMDEDVNNRVNDAVEDLLGLHPSAWTLVQHTNRTILRLAQAGNVVLVGRGANLITAHLSHILHVRLVANLDFRIRHIAHYYELSFHEAADLVKKSDLARARYVRRNFKSSVQDPLQYHLTISTSQTGFEEAARIIGDAVLNLHRDPVPA